MTEPHLPSDPSEGWGPLPAGVPGAPASPAASGPWTTAPIVGPPPSLGPAASATEPYVAAPPARRKPARIAAVAVASVLAVVAGLFGVSELTAADGAESPEAAVQALFDAMDREDVLGVVEALDPNERDILRPAVEELGEQADRLDLAADDLDLGAVQGADVRIEGLELETTELRDGLVSVEVVAGTLSGSARLSDLPVGSVVRDLLDEVDDADPDREEEDLAGLQLVARRSDGWHVSLLYSLAEVVRNEEEPVSAFPTADAAIGAKGEATPEAAVRAGIAAALDLDVRRLIELTPPDEMAVLHEYGSLLVDAAAEEADDVDASDVPVLSGLELTTSDGPDGTKVVAATAFRLEDDDGEFTMELRDGCITSTSTWSYEIGDDEGDSGTDTSTICEGDDQDDVFGRIVPFFGMDGLSGLRVVAEEHDGEWYLSPSRTLVESLLGSVRELTPDDLQRTIRYWNGEWWVMESDEFWEACGVDRPALDVSEEDGEAAYAACWEALPDDYEGSTYGYDPNFEYDEEFDDPTEVCWEQGETDAEVEACVADLVAAGEVEPIELGYLRCEAVYDVVDEVDDPSDEDWEVAEEAFDACLAEYRDGVPLELDDDESGTTATTAPSRPTIPLPPPSTTVPAAPTTTAPAGDVAPSTTTPG